MQNAISETYLAAHTAPNTLPEVTRDPVATDLWQHLEGYHIDTPEVELPFSARLARENGWSREYTERVMEEYKCFLFLAATVDFPVTPSEPIDQAWHLHL